MSVHVMSDRSSSRLASLAERIQREIPITCNLEFTLEPCDDGGLVASAPLAPNTNHTGTAFGGSLSMLATLTGWAMVQLVLDRLGADGQVVVQESQIDYREPVCRDFSIRCPWPDQDTLDRFHAMFERWGKARLTLRCAVEEHGKTAVDFLARYVALRETT